jgi:[ribosomal protein S18]-alanine N-acetyltransferase
MSAQPIDPADACAHLFAPMQLADVAEVAAIERAIYSAPWSEGNFVDSLNAGYCAWTLRAAGESAVGRGPIIGYFVLMAAVDEAHLLNVSIAADRQGQGHGLFLLHRAVEVALDYKATSIILEVRPSNRRALAVYRRFGFREHGLRRRYYPVSATDQRAREDAIVMKLPL